MDNRYVDTKHHCDIIKTKQQFVVRMKKKSRKKSKS